MFVATQNCRDRGSFTSQHLLNEDMAISGRNYSADKARTKRERETKFTSPADLLKHCLSKAIKSAEQDFNGDLQLLQYLITVMEQDVDTRMAAFQELEVVGGAEATGRSRKTLLENSLAWRIFAGSVSNSN